MSWVIYNAETNLYDGAYSRESDAIRFHIVVTTLWEGSEWTLIETDGYPHNRFHADHKERLQESFGEARHDLLIQVENLIMEEGKFLSGARWAGKILIIETVRPD